MSSRKKSMKNNKNLIAIPTGLKTWLEKKFVSFYENVLDVFQSNKDIKKNILILVGKMLYCNSLLSFPHARLRKLLKFNMLKWNQENYQ